MDVGADKIYEFSSSDFTDDQIEFILNGDNGINRTQKLTLTHNQFEKLFLYFKFDFPEHAKWLFESVNNGDIGNYTDALYMLKLYVYHIKNEFFQDERTPNVYSAKELSDKRQQYKRARKEDTLEQQRLDEAKLTRKTQEQYPSQPHEQYPPEPEPEPEPESEPTLEQLSQKANEQAKNRKLPTRGTYLSRIFGLSKGGKRKTRKRARKRSTRRVKKL